MKDIKIERQGSFDDISPEYAAFVAKFKPKKTTDDCYTPKAVYDAVLEWCRKRYKLPESAPIVRPFYPGGDYERFKYPDGCVVIDNPPFSILSNILRFYNRWGIDYFLFAPALMMFAYGNNGKTNFVVCGVNVIYENGANVPTSFVTNLGENIIEVRGDLYQAVRAANVKQNKTLPKYVFPDCVATAAALQRISTAGVNFAVPRGEALHTRRLDAMDKMKQSGIFGGGFILSKRAAAERAAAERAAAERAAAERAAAERVKVWKLSERERALQDILEPKKGRT